MGGAGTCSEISSILLKSYLGVYDRQCERDAGEHDAVKQCSAVQRAVVKCRVHYSAIGTEQDNTYSTAQHSVPQHNRY